MKGDSRNRGFFQRVRDVFRKKHWVPYPESMSGVKTGTGQKQRKPSVKGRFGSQGPASLRKYRRMIRRALRETGRMMLIRGKARTGSRPLGRISPYVTSSMKRAAKRAKYDQNS